MDNSTHTYFSVDFTKPDEVVIGFIQNTRILLKKTACQPEDIMPLLITYTTLKFHPYNDHLYLLTQISYIKATDKTTTHKKTTHKKTARVITQPIKNLIAKGVWDLELKNKKWRICDIKLQRGVKTYHSLFYNETAKIDEI